MTTVDAPHLTLTGDELTAIARRLGARRFPGVGSSVYDEVPAAHHGVLTKSLLASIAARGLVAEQDGRLIASPHVAMLLGPSLRSGISYSITRVTEDGHQSTTALGAVDTTVVWHRADGPFHRFDVVRTDGDIGAALLDVVDPSPAATEPEPAPHLAGARRFRRRRSQLRQATTRPELVPPAFGEALDHWRATTTVTQVGAPSGAVAFSWLAVVDAGPGRLWSVEPDSASPDDGLLDSDDPLLVLTPLDRRGLRARLSS